MKSKEFKLDIESFFRGFPKRPEDAHKGSFGRILLVSGSYGMAGAACLNIIGAKALGSGYICVSVPDDIYGIVASGYITPVFYPYDAKEDSKAVLKTVQSIKDLRSVAFGSGANNNPSKYRILNSLLQECRCPLILDAEALRLIGEDSEFINGASGGNTGMPVYDILSAADCPVIITPHSGEFSALTGVPAAELKEDDRIKAASEFSEKNNVITVLKDAWTAVTAPDGRYYINRTGNQGLAQAGSGDVLTGMMAAMCSFIADPFEAACMAVFAHGLAADELCKTHPKQTMPLEKMADAMDMLFFEHGF